MAFAPSERYLPASNGHSGFSSALADGGVYQDRQQPERGRKSLLVDMLLAPAELPWLLGSEVWRGKNIPHGDGSDVYVLPGFLGNDFYLGWMRNWLRRINYNPRALGVGLNTDPEHITLRLVEESRREYELTGRKSHYVGHSLGGAIARAASIVDPEPVASINAFGSPIDGDFEQEVDPFVFWLAKQTISLLDGSDVSRQKMESLLQDPREDIKVTYVQTVDDGVVHWKATVDPCKGTKNVQISGSHIGLAWNPYLYQELAHSLHDAQEKIPKPEDKILRFPAGFAA